jgi:hypothetical protein
MAPGPSDTRDKPGFAPGGSAPVEALVPGEDEIFGWIEAVVSQGIRRPGYPADQWCEDWLVERFTELGLHDVRLEPVEVAVWLPRSASITVWPAADPSQAVELPAFALPHTEATEGLEANVQRLGGDDGGGDLRGAIAVEDLELMRMPQSELRLLATSTHDPAGEFDDLVQVLPFGTRIRGLLDPVLQAGAGAFVGILSGMPWDTHDYYVPYDGEPQPLPAVWLSPADGARLSALLEAGPVRGRIAVDATRTTGVSHNVLGVLPGRSSEYVVIGSHHDAPWASAVEDGSGIALVLAQASYWAAVPVDERPHNLVFLLNAGHMVGGAGSWQFVADHRDLLDRTVLAVHLEHAAVECRPEDGRLVPTGEPEVRWWFTSQEPQLERAVADALEAEDLRRSLVFRPEVFFELPPTDGGPLHTVGVPLVNYLTAPMYLFDSCDTLDKVHRPSLVPVTRAVARIIGSTVDRTAAGVRAAVVPTGGPPQF